MLDTIISLLAPHSCIACSQAGRVLCDECCDGLQAGRHPICIGCGTTDTRGVCASCTDQWPVERAFVFAERSGTLKRLIDEFKYNHIRAAYKDMAALAASILPADTEARIVAIPTIGTHIRQRGYDHMALTAKRLATRPGLTYSPVIRRRNSTVQHGASKRVRSRQADEAFYVRGPLDPGLLYIVFDDIVTTGSSLKAAADVLREAGAVRIWVLALARQPLELP